jgi:hypothetical protein
MGIFDTGKQLLSQARERAQALEERLRARQTLEIAGLVKEVRAALDEAVTLTPLPADPELLDGKVPLGLGKVSTVALREERLRKVVLSHIALKPVIEGFALTLIPRADLDYPIFAADLMALPTRVSMNADVYGLPAKQKRLLEPLWPAFDALGAGPGPLWAAHLGSGRGLHAKLPPQRTHEGFDALLDALDLYLAGLSEAEPGPSGDSQAQFFQAFHENGPRRGPLGQVMGRDWAERYSRLIFE